MSTIHISRIEVVGSTLVNPLKIALPYKTLPGDVCLRGAQAQQHTGGPVVFDKGAGVNVDQERVLACHWHSKQRDFLNITLNEFPHDFSNTRCEVSLCLYDSDDPWGIGATVFTAQHQTSNEAAQRFGVRLNWVRGSRTALQQPFGLWNEFIVVVGRDSHVFVVTPPVHLELYWFPAEAQLPPLLSSGVPLQLLRMFVLPSSVNHTNSRVEWVKKVVGIVHGSNKPFTGATSTTLRHWLKYDVLDGSGSFTGAYSSMFFDVLKWVDAYRLWKLTKYVTKVNCYDQAAILQTVLSLGIPFRQIHWEWQQVYGFVGADSKLVGWGECNNPYFDTRQRHTFDRTNQVIADEDPNRRPIRNHSYLTLTDRPLALDVYLAYNTEMRTVSSHSGWKRKIAEFEKMGTLPRRCIVDACIGPRMGNEIMTEDVDSDLIIEDLPAAQNSPYTDVREDSQRYPKRWKQVYYTGPSVVVSREDQLGDPPYLPSHATVAGQHELLVGSQGMQSARTLGGHVGFLENAFENWVRTQISKLGWQNVADIPVRPLRLDDGSFVLETRASYKKQDDDPEMTSLSHYVALRILVCPNVELAADHLARHLATLVHNSLLDPATVCSITTTGVPVVGNSALRAFTHRNVAIDLAGDDGDLFDVKDGKDSDLLIQKLVEIAVEMCLTPGNCWEDLL